MICGVAASICQIYLFKNNQMAGFSHNLDSCPPKLLLWFFWPPLFLCRRFLSPHFLPIAFAVLPRRGVHPSDAVYLAGKTCVESGAQRRCHRGRQHAEREYTSRQLAVFVVVYSGWVWVRGSVSFFVSCCSALKVCYC